jgi:hypothetical protein
LPPDLRASDHETSDPDPIRKPVELTPELGMGALPPFHKLGEYLFQDLCRDLLDSDSDVAYCEVYGTRGQRQYGIDLLAPRKDSKGYDVAQCKAYATCTPADIKAVSDEFLTHWSHWREHGIRRFILCVACDVSDRNCQNEEITQRHRFKDIGVGYEVWSAAHIRNLLRSRSDLVTSYFHPPDVWVREICGLGAAAANQISLDSRGIHGVAQTLLLEQLARRVSSDTAREIDALREAWREGRREAAIAGVARLRNDRAGWEILDGDTKAQVLRFEAGLALDEADGLRRARVLAEEARTMAPGNGDRRIGALIARKEHGPETALSVLGEPQTAEERHLAAGLLIESGRVREALRLVEAPSDDPSTTADTFRLQALAYAGTFQFERARLAAQRASELSPQWESIRTAAAIVDYLGSVSPGTYPEGVPAIPLPVRWAFVLRDDESAARIRSAGRWFAELVGGRLQAEDEKSIYETWHLACLANDPDRQEEAGSLCRALLEGNPAHPGALRWALGRNYDISVTQTEAALVAAVEASTSNLQPVVLLAMCLVAWDKPGDAVQLLDQTRDRFVAPDHARTWLYLRTEASALVGSDPIAITAEGDLDDDDREDLNLFALRTRAEHRGEWTQYAEAAEAAYLRTNHAPYLYEAVVAWGRAQIWNRAAKYSEELVEAVRSVESVRVAALAAHNDNQFDLCIHLIDASTDRFPQQKLPPELRSIRARALRARGKLGDAVVEAEDVAREFPTLENELALAQMLLEKGDLPRVVAVARRIADRNDLDTSSALRIARVVAADDPPLAVRLWRLACTQGISDEWVGGALELAFRLGLDEETRELTTRMTRLAEAGLHGHQAFSTSEFLELHVESTEHRQQTFDLYQGGMVPIHLVASELGLALTRLYRQNLSVFESNSNPTRQFGLLAFHGVRASLGRRTEQAPRWRLHADITAILLSAHLGILDKVEQVFETIHIPEGLTRELALMRSAHVHNQPRRLENAMDVVRLASEGKITPADFSDEPVHNMFENLVGEERAVMLARASEQAGYVLDYLPFGSSTVDPPPDLPAEAQARFVNVRAIVDALRNLGPLTRAEHRQALRRLGTLGREEAVGGPLMVGNPLFCYGNTAEVLASARVLGAATERFRVFVDEDVIRGLRSELDSALERQAIVEWISELMKRLSQGLETGRYSIIAAPAAAETELGPAQGLRTLLACKPERDEAIWIDDRFVSGHWIRDGGAPIITTIDVLDGLDAHGALSRPELYELLTRLRAANVRYVPLSARELVHHLEDAQVVDGEVAETHALTVIRRYTAAWLLGASGLQPPLLPDGSPNPRAETALFEGLARAIASAVRHLLTRGTAAREARLARAEWVMRNLFVDYGAMRRFSGLAGPHDDARWFSAITMVRFVTHGLTIGWKDRKAGRARRRRYFRWVWHNLLRPRADADALFLPLIADILKDYLLPHPNVPEEYRLSVSNTLHRQLPSRLRDALNAIPEVRASLGLQAVDMVTLRGVQIEHGVFIRAAAAAINGRRTQVPILGRDEVLEFIPSGATGDIARFRVDGLSAEPAHVRDDVLGVLTDSASERETWLRAHVEWFDGPATETDEWIANVASIEDPVRRFTDVEKTRSESPEWLYEQLAVRLRAGETIRWADLKPAPPERLLRHFRLRAACKSGQQFQRELIQAGDQLIAESGLVPALERWAGLPVRLPTVFVSEVGKLPREEQIKLVKQLLKASGSPVSDLHLIRLLWHLREVNPAFGRLAQVKAGRMLRGECEVRFEAFRSVLRWADEAVSRLQGASTWPARLRLALVWLHGHRVYSTFAGVKADMQRLDRLFRETQFPLSARVISDDPTYTLAIAQPARVQRLPFLLSGFAYAFEGASDGEIKEGLRQRFASAAFMQTDDVRLPHVSLLRNPALASNGLRSFLGNRRASTLRTILPEADAALLASSGLRQFGRVLAERIREDPEFALGWYHTSAVVGDLPPPSEILSALTELAMGFGFGPFAHRDQQACGIALRQLACAASYSGDSALVTRVWETIIAITQSEAARHHRSDTDLLNGEANIAFHLVQATADLARASDDRATVLATVTSMFGDMVTSWPALARSIGGFAQRAWQELPPDEAQHFASLAVRCRAVE